MTERKRLSKRRLYYLALRHAIDERESFAQAHEPPIWATDRADDIKVRDDALWQASEFRRLLKEDYGIVDQPLDEGGGQDALVVAMRLLAK